MIGGPRPDGHNRVVCRIKLIGMEGIAFRWILLKKAWPLPVGFLGIVISSPR